jgi:hypothetical protein
VKNFCMDLHRSPRTKRAAAEDLERAAEQLALGEDEDLDALLERRESDTTLHLLVHELPERLKRVMELVLAGYKYDEIGLDLCITSTNVRKRAEEGRALLHTMLQFGQAPPRLNVSPDATQSRPDAGRRADGHSMPGYRPPAYAHLLKNVDGSPLSQPIVCFVVSPDERLEQRSKTLEKYTSLHQGGHVKHMELAELYLSQGRWARSMELLGVVLDHQPFPGLPLLRLAMMHFCLGDRGTATSLLRTGLLAPMPQVMEGFLRGALGFCEDDFAAAAHHWRGCLALNRQWQLPLQSLVGLAIQLGDLGTAQTLLDGGLADFPQDRVLHFWRCCLPAPRTAALQFARTAVRLFPEDPIAAFQLRRACVASGVAAPPVGRAERRNRFEAMDLDLKLLAQAQAGRMDHLATILRRMPPEAALKRSWQEWLSAPRPELLPPSPLLFAAPVLPF